MEKKNVFTLIILLAVITISSYGQEMLLPLGSNPLLRNTKVQNNVSLRDALALPFIDDFSYSTNYPDQNKWIGTQAFVNTTLPLNPISIGVASLDGLKANGQPYDSLSHSFASVGGADTLTSQPILMGNVSPGDSVYLSFFYQPGGLGDYPNSYQFNVSNFGVTLGDSLVLEFKDNNGGWNHIWAKDGFSSQQFLQVMIPVKNVAYFHNDFQFRFRNYASLIGQYDIWNIDYVKLNMSRSFNDVIITDVSHQYLPTSILKNYQVMPWNQFQDFQSGEKAESQNIFVKNNFTVSKNTSRQMLAEEKVTGTSLYSTTIQSSNLDAGSESAYSFSVPDIQSFNLDSLNIATTFIIGASGDNNRSNDTITRNQIFSNYMSYDDGTPEATYRLLGSPASLAMEYHLNTPDTLQGIEIMFAHDEINLLQNVFSIYVWSSLSPEDSLLRDEFLLPKFVNELNGFSFYRLSRPLLITDTFYIGWLQISLQTDLKMDIGFDLNDTANQHLWYNIDGTWKQSALPGAAMIRPVIGSTIPFGVGIDESKNQNHFSIFPNPATDVLFMQGKKGDIFNIEVTDYSGRLLLSNNNSNSISIRNISSGFYLARITDLKTGTSEIKKFVKE